MRDILIIDDENLMIGIKNSLQRDLECKVDLASSLHSARYFLTNFEYSVVIVEPSLFGDTHKTRQTPLIDILGAAIYKKIPVVVLTSLRQEELAPDYSLKQGFHYDFYARKPLLARETVELVQKALQSEVAV